MKRKLESTDVFTAHEFIKFLQKDTTAFEGLVTFLEASELHRNSQGIDIIDAFCVLSSNGKEILNLLNSKTKLKSEEAYLVFECCRIILNRIFSDLFQYEILAQNLIKEILSSHFDCLLRLTNNTNKSKHIKTALNLFSLFISCGKYGGEFGQELQKNKINDNKKEVELKNKKIKKESSDLIHESPKKNLNKKFSWLKREIVPKLNLKNQNWKNLVNRKNIKDEHDVKFCLVEMILCILRTSNQTLIISLLEANELMHTLIKHLHGDTCLTATLLINGLSSYVLNNSKISKTIKVKLFDESSLHSLVLLLRWKGSKSWIEMKNVKKHKVSNKIIKKIEDEFDPENLSQEQILVREVTFELLSILTTSFSRGVVFKDNNCFYLAKNNPNVTITNFLLKLPRPLHKDPLVFKLACDIFITMPHQLFFLFNNPSSDSFSPRFSENWFRLMDLMIEVYSSCSLNQYRHLNLFMTGGNGEKFGEMFCLMQLPCQRIRESLEQAIRSSEKLIVFQALRFYCQMIKQLCVSAGSISQMISQSLDLKAVNFRVLSSFSQSFFKTLLQNLIPLDYIFNCFFDKLKDGSSKIDERFSDYISKLNFHDYEFSNQVLKTICFYYNLFEFQKEQISLFESNFENFSYDKISIENKNIAKMNELVIKLFFNINEMLEGEELVDSDKVQLLSNFWIILFNFEVNVFELTCHHPQLKQLVQSLLEKSFLHIINCENYNIFQEGLQEDYRSEDEDSYDEGLIGESPLKPDHVLTFSSKKKNQVYCGKLEDKSNILCLLLKTLFKFSSRHFNSEEELLLWIFNFKNLFLLEKLIFKMETVSSDEFVFERKKEGSVNPEEVNLVSKWFLEVLYDSFCQSSIFVTEALKSAKTKNSVKKNNLIKCYLSASLFMGFCCGFFSIEQLENYNKDFFFLSKIQSPSPTSLQELLYFFNSYSSIFNYFTKRSLDVDYNNHNEKSLNNELKNGEYLKVGLLFLKCFTHLALFCLQQLKSSESSRNIKNKNNYLAKLREIFDSINKLFFLQPRNQNDFEINFPQNYFIETLNEKKNKNTNFHFNGLIYLFSQADFIYYYVGGFPNESGNVDSILHQVVSDWLNLLLSSHFHLVDVLEKTLGKTLGTVSQKLEHLIKDENLPHHPTLIKTLLVNIKLIGNEVLYSFITKNLPYVQSDHFELMIQLVSSFSQKLSFSTKNLLYLRDQMPLMIKTTLLFLDIFSIKTSSSVDNSYLVNLSKLIICYHEHSYLVTTNNFKVMADQRNPLESPWFKSPFPQKILTLLKSKSFCSVSFVGWFLQIPNDGHQKQNLINQVKKFFLTDPDWTEEWFSYLTVIQILSHPSVIYNPEEFLHFLREIIKMVYPKIIKDIKKKKNGKIAHLSLNWSEDSSLNNSHTSEFDWKISVFHSFPNNALPLFTFLNLIGKVESSGINYRNELLDIIESYLKNNNSINKLFLLHLYLNIIKIKATKKETMKLLFFSMDYFVESFLDWRKNGEMSKSMSDETRNTCDFIRFILSSFSLNLNEDSVVEFSFKKSWMDFITVGLKYLFSDSIFIKTLSFLIYKGVPFQKDEENKFNEKLQPDLIKIFSMLFAHSSFVSVSMETNDSSIKEEMFKLVYVLMKKSTGDKRRKLLFKGLLPTLFAAFNATLSKTDKCIMSLMQMAEKEGLSFMDMSPFYWGQKSLDLRASKKLLFTSSLMPLHSINQLLDQIDSDLMIETSYSFPLRSKLSYLNYDPFKQKEVQRDPFESSCSKLQKNIYNPSFFLTVFHHLLSEENNQLENRKFIDKGCFSLAVSALSSFQPEVRKLGGNVLFLFYNQLGKTKFVDKDQFVILLDVLRNGFDSFHKRLSSIHSSFLIKTSHILLRPDDHLYTLINQFLLVRPSLDLNEVPEFYKLFFSSSLQQKKERNFFFEILTSGMRTPQDFQICLKRRVFSNIMTFYHSPFSDYQNKIQILNVLEKTCSISSFHAWNMIKKRNILSWLSTACLTNESCTSNRVHNSQSPSLITLHISEKVVSIICILWLKIKRSKNKLKDHEKDENNSPKLKIISPSTTSEFLVSIDRLLSSTSSPLSNFSNSRSKLIELKKMIINDTILERKEFENKNYNYPVPFYDLNSRIK